MSKRGAIVIHVLFIAFLVFAWLYRPHLATGANSASAMAASASATLVPAATYSPAPTYTPLPTYTPYPTTATTPTPEPTPTHDPLILREEFDGKLDKGWRLFNENKQGWSLDKNPGWLDLSLSQGTNCCPDASWENLFLYELPAGDYEVETKMVFAPSGGETAGLVLCKGPESCLYLGKNQKYLPVEFVSAGADLTYLRIRCEGDTATLSVSKDGVDWVDIGTEDARAYSLAGVVATQGDPAHPNSAQFDYFTIRALP